MSVHIGEISSEIQASGPDPAPEPGPTVWQERHRTELVLQRLARDAARTSTEEAR